MSLFEHRYAFLIFYLAMASLFAYSAYLTMYQALVREQSVSSDFVNTLCRYGCLLCIRREIANHYGSDKKKQPPLDLTRSDLDDICRPLEDRFTIDKFLMFATDCWPSHEAKDVFDHYKEHAKVYIVDIPGAKYSHAIYTAYLTGQLPTNYKGKPILGDHLVRSLQRSPLHRNRTNYIGPEWCFLALFGKNEYNTTFVDIRIENEPLDVNYEHVYPWFFERAGFMTSYFNDLVHSNRSMMTHSAVYDHRQHGEHRGLGATAVTFPHTQRLARGAQADFKSLKPWFDAHSDYTLILFSDHGVDQYDMTGYRMHGLTENGNEPFILIYNSKLTSNKGPLRIDVVDVAPTLAQYFRGPIDIPANSIGISHTHLSAELGADDIRLACRNALQLLASAQHRKLSVNTASLTETIHEALDVMSGTAPVTGNATLDVHTKLRSWMTDVKLRMYSVIHLPIFELAFYALLAMASTLSIVVFNNPRLDSFILRDEVRRFVWELARMFGMYVVAYLQMMFIYDGWAQAHFGAKLWRAVIFITTLSMLKVLDVLPSTPPMVYIRWALYRNAFIILTGLVAMDLLYELVDILNERVVRYYVTQFVTLTLAIWIAHSFYSTIIERRDAAYDAVARTAAQLGRPVPRKPRSLRPEMCVVIVLILMIYAFSYTPEDTAMFTADGDSWYSGWHILALTVYVVAGVLMPLWLVLAECGDVGSNGELLPHNGLERLIVPVNILLLLLNIDSTTNQLWLALFNWQMHVVSLPIAALLKQAQMHAQAPQIVTRLTPSNTRASAGLWSVATQLAAVYAFCQPFVTMSIFFKDVINFDVHPFAGRIGQRDYDNRPMLCAMLMVLHKYGPFVLYAIYSASLARRPQTLGAEARLSELAPPPPAQQTALNSSLSASSGSSTAQSSGNGGVSVVQASKHRRRTDVLDSSSASMMTTTTSPTTSQNNSNSSNNNADAVSISIESNNAIEWTPTPELALACLERHAKLLRSLDAQVTRVFFRRLNHAGCY